MYSFVVLYAVYISCEIYFTILIAKRLKKQATDTKSMLNVICSLSDYFVKSCIKKESASEKRHRRLTKKKSE